MANVMSWGVQHDNAHPEYDMISLLTAIGLTPGASSTVHIYTQTIHRTSELSKEQYNIPEHLGTKL
jgi:hypothetical protein